MTRHRPAHLPRRAAVGLAVVALLMGACGESGDHPGEERTDDVPTVEPTTPEEPDNNSDDAHDADLPPEVDAAVEDLAEHLDVDAAHITVVSYADVTWPDGAIGCPEPGQSYTQALVPGSRLVLEADDSEYFYHAGREPDLVRCDRAPQDPVDEATS